MSTLLSCSALEELASIRKPELRVTDARVTGFSLQDMEITFDVAVDNPNPLAAELQDYRYDLQLNDRSFIQGNNAKLTQIAPNTQSMVEVPVEVNYRDLYSTFTELYSRDETNYLIAFNAGVQVPTLGRLDLPFEYSGTFPMVKLPGMSFEGISVKSLSLTKAILNLELKVQNPNAFDLRFSDLSYEIELNGLSPLSGTVDDALNLSQKSSGNVIIPIEVNILDLGSAARNLLTGGEEIQYTLRGTTRVGSSLPLFEQSIFNFDKEGVVDILR